LTGSPKHGFFVKFRIKSHQLIAANHISSPFYIQKHGFWLEPRPIKALHSPDSYKGRLQKHHLSQRLEGGLFLSGNCY